jgi:hypothetical protein
MKWLSESNAFIFVQPDAIHSENMVVHIDCEIKGNFYAWANFITEYKCKRCGRMRKIPLQDYLMQAEGAYRKTLDGLNG